MIHGIMPKKPGDSIIVTCTHCGASFTAKKPLTTLLYAAYVCPECKKLGVKEDKKVRY